MIEKIYARQMENGLWQWRARENNSWQNQSYFTGDVEALLTSVEGQRELTVCLLLRGSSCVSREEVAETKNRRTLAKMLPYELEEDIIDPIDELHFAFGEIEAGKVSLIYTRADALENAISKLEGIGCDVPECLPDYLLLEREDNELIVVWDENEVLVHFGRDQGFAVQEDIAQLYLQQSNVDADKIQKITLVAPTSAACDELMSWLSPDLCEGPEIISREGGFWDCIDVSPRTNTLDLRSGQFGRQLPLLKWWQAWQTPAYYAAAAVLVAVVVNFALYFEAKSEYQNILAVRKEVFLNAVPKGRWQTPERELKAALGGGKGSEASTNFMYLLAGVAKALGSNDDVSLGSFRYSGDQQELVISFEVTSFERVESVRSAIEKLGYTAETLRAAAQGDVFQARMKVSQTGATS